VPATGPAAATGGAALCLGLWQHDRLAEAIAQSLDACQVAVDTINCELATPPT
ncbi:MAG: hypothetical protein HC929_15895, partial [Leptolyngbyaceae cyanobacterium SM2_5_2]|nr:hypothetical protein [Leptolyngbyaceae cyanobacterium SM2_5_2]